MDDDAQDRWRQGVLNTPNAWEAQSLGWRLLVDDPDFIDDVLAMNPFPTVYRAAVYKRLRHPPGGFDRAAQQVWADRVLKAPWLVPARFEYILAHCDALDAHVLANTVTRHRQFRPRHILATLAMREAGPLDELMTAYRLRGPEYSAVTSAFAALAASTTPSSRRFTDARHEHRLEYLARTYGADLEALPTETINAVAAVLDHVDSPDVQTWRQVLDTARTVTQTGRRAPRIKLPTATAP